MSKQRVIEVVADWVGLEGPTALRCEQKKIELAPACRQRGALDKLAQADCDGQAIDITPIDAPGEPFCPDAGYGLGGGGSWSFLGPHRARLPPGTTGVEYSCCQDVDPELDCRVASHAMNDCGDLAKVDARVEERHQSEREHAEKAMAPNGDWHSGGSFLHSVLSRPGELEGRVSGQVHTCTLIERDGRVVASLKDGDRLTEGPLAWMDAVPIFGGSRSHEMRNATVRHSSCCEAKYLVCHPPREK